MDELIAGLEIRQSYVVNRQFHLTLMALAAIICA
jgi:hypothetical protein